MNLESLYLLTESFFIVGTSFMPMPLHMFQFLLFIIFFCSFIFNFYVPLYILVMWLVKNKKKIKFTMLIVYFN